MTTPIYTIQDADETHLHGILEIFNEQIATSTSVLKDKPFDLEDRRKWMKDTKNAGFPVFVAVPVPPKSDPSSSSSPPTPAGEPPTQEPSVLGFAYYSALGEREGYRFAVESTIYVHKSIRGGGGIGKALMERLLSHAQEKGNIHALVAISTASNVASIRFHEKFGFVYVGTMREVGYKFGEWQDVTVMQLILPGGGPSMEEGK